MPDSIPLPDAAAIYMPFHLAWLALRERARVQAGETLLVHAAAGGAGSAALQLGVDAGARVIAVAGGPEKGAFCRDLGAHVTIDHRATDFVDAVLEETGGRGVDVAFDTIGGDITVQTFRCMAFDGRHVLAGFASGIEHEDEGIVPRPVLFGNFSLLGVCHAYADDALEFRRLTGLNFPSHAQGEETHRQILELIDQRAVRPIVGQDVAFADLPAALDAMEQRTTIGRTVVRV
jgi:NADPH2:quinone reductase